MLKRVDYLIVGGGMAADAAWAAIRRAESASSVFMLSEEKHPAYQRPPLSKKLWTEERMEDIWCASSGTGSIALTTLVSAIDPSQHQVHTASGVSYEYRKLLLATGGRPRRLNDLGAEDDPDVIYFRSLDDYLKLYHAVKTHSSVLVIGGGFVGAELAAQLAKLKKSVSIIFPESGILGHVLPKDLAAHVSQVYVDHGVSIYANMRVLSVRHRSEGFEVQTDNHTLLTADVVVAGLGILPNIELAQAAQLTTGDGIFVDSLLRTNDPDVYAAGDVALFPWGGQGPHVRVEHEDNAISQGRLAGRNMTGAEKPYTHLPFFYSDLFHLGFEAIGRLDPSLTVYADWMQRDEEGVLYYLDQDRVVGILNWNVWDKIKDARKILQSGEKISDPSQLKNRIKTT